MNALSNRPGGLDKDLIGLHRSRVFVGQRCVLGSSLVVPLWLVWKEYEAFGQRNGFEAEAKHLRSLLDNAPWATVIERPQARGKLKTIVEGLGLKPQ